MTSRPRARSSRSTPQTPTSSARSPGPSNRYSSEKGASAGSIASAATASRQTSVGALRARRLRAEAPQGPKAAFAEDAPGLLADDAEDARRRCRPRCGPDRTRRRSTSLRGIPGGGEGRGGPSPRTPPRPDHALEERAEDLPHLAPALAGGTTERPGMLRAEHRRIGVVVDRDELRAPEEDHLSPGWQQDADRAPEALRPRLHGAERVAGQSCSRMRPPISAAAREEVGPRGASGRVGPTLPDSAARRSTACRLRLPAIAASLRGNAGTVLRHGLAGVSVLRGPEAMTALLTVPAALRGDSGNIADSPFRTAAGALEGCARSYHGTQTETDFRAGEPLARASRHQRCIGLAALTPAGPRPSVGPCRSGARGVPRTSGPDPAAPYGWLRYRIGRVAGSGGRRLAARAAGRAHRRERSPAVAITPPASARILRCDRLPAALRRASEQRGATRGSCSPTARSSPSRRPSARSARREASSSRVSAVPTCMRRGGRPERSA